MNETKIIIIKNKVNWPMAVILPVPLIILILMVLIIFPTTVVSHFNSSDFLSSFLYSLTYVLFYLIIPSVFLIVFLYLWLWNTFGVTIVKVNRCEIKLKKKGIYSTRRKPLKFLK